MDPTLISGKTDGKAIREIASTVAAMVPKRIFNKHRVNEALHNMQWIVDF
jgi:hypothetical protein